MEKKKANLILEQGIIEGHVARQLKEFFPQLNDAFTQRKQYDEYYYKEIKEIEYSLLDLCLLTNLDYIITLQKGEIKLDY